LKKAGSDADKAKGIKKEVAPAKKDDKKDEEEKVSREGY